jgi:hypothetical protein
MFSRVRAELIISKLAVAAAALRSPANDPSEKGIDQV